jgi:hypothetical protein
MFMNRYWVWGLSVALVGGLSALALAADPYMQPNQTTLVQKISDMFTAQPAKSSAAGGNATPPTITAPLSQEVQTKCLQAEDEAWMRRVNVCDALRRVAEEKGDLALARKADELERQARKLYDARVAALGVPKIKTPVGEPKQVLRLEEPETPKAAADQLIAPMPPVPSDIHEVKP